MVTYNEAGETTETVYAYDPVGNRVKETEDGVEPLSTYNSLNQLQTVKQTGEGGATRSYTYDPNGNLIKESGGSIGNEIAYGYDVKNRLEQATIQQSDGDKLVQVNRYNGDGQRIQKKEGGEETNYYYQGTTVVATTDGKGALTSHHLLDGENDIIASGRYGGEDNDGYYFYHQDYRNSTTTILDSEGKEVQSYRYGNFGETKSRGSADFSNEVCYTGGIYDSSTGLYYLNARYYDPKDGRFTIQDTYRGEQTDPRTLHLYAYCENDPMNKLDPSGHLAVFAYYHKKSTSNMNRFAKKSHYFNMQYVSYYKEVGSANQFVNAWNKMPYRQETVYLYLHGEQGKLFFWQSSGTISSLKSDLVKKKIKRIYLFSCKGGKGGKSIKKNLAYFFSKKTGATVRACNTGVSFSKSTSGRYYARKQYLSIPSSYWAGFRTYMSGRKRVYKQSKVNMKSY